MNFRPPMLSQIVLSQVVLSQVVLKLIVLWLMKLELLMIIPMLLRTLWRTHSCVPCRHSCRYKLVMPPPLAFTRV